MDKLIWALPGICSAVVYIWSRAKAKAEGSTKPGYKTTEFWLTIALSLPGAIKTALGG